MAYLLRSRFQSISNNYRFGKNRDYSKFSFWKKARGVVIKNGNGAVNGSGNGDEHKKDLQDFLLKVNDDFFPPPLVKFGSNLLSVSGVAKGVKKSYKFVKLLTSNKAVPNYSVNTEKFMEIPFHVKDTKFEDIRVHITTTNELLVFDETGRNVVRPGKVELPPGLYLEENVSFVHDPIRQYVFVIFKDYKAHEQQVLVKASLVHGYGIAPDHSLTCSVNADETPTEAAAPKPPAPASSTTGSMVSFAFEDVPPQPPISSVYGEKDAGAHDPPTSSH